MGKKAVVNIKEKNKSRAESVSVSVDKGSLNTTVNTVNSEKTSTSTSNKQSKRVNKIENTLEAMELTTWVLYISHLPWGANEVMLRKFFD